MVSGKAFLSTSRTDCTPRRLNPGRSMMRAVGIRIVSLVGHRWRGCATIALHMSLIRSHKYQQDISPQTGHCHTIAHNQIPLIAQLRQLHSIFTGHNLWYFARKRLPPPLQVGVNLLSLPPRTARFVRTRTPGPKGGIGTLSPLQQVAQIFSRQRECMPDGGHHRN